MIIRPIAETDDFEELLRLMNETVKRFNPDPTFFGFGYTAEGLREKFFGSSAQDKGFVVEINGTVVAFMAVSLSSVTKHGSVEFGFVEGNEQFLHELVQKCAELVHENGGEKMFKFAFSKFGQIRNNEITFWEQLGFVSEEYSSVNLFLDLKQWQEPAEFSNTNIVPATDLSLEQIIQMLHDEGEHSIADRLQEQFDAYRKMDQVILTLLDEATQEIAGLAIYRVYTHNKGTEHEFLNAMGLGLYFRSKFDLSPAEKRRLLHSALLSMKQLDILHVLSPTTLKHFDIFAILIREGFEGLEKMEKNSIIHLYKTV